MKNKVEIYDVELSSCFSNEKYTGFVISWDSNIGFGELTVSVNKDGKLEVQTETMSDNEDKEFIHLVMNKFIEKMKVIE